MTGVGSSEPSVVSIDGATLELRVDAHLAPSVLRAFAGVTQLDAEVDSLAVPRRPIWLNLSVRLLRWYRSKRTLSVARFGTPMACAVGCSHVPLFIAEWVLNPPTVEEILRAIALANAGWGGYPKYNRHKIWIMFINLQI